ncbi:MAG: hypothetical protein F6J93_12005 [Oscillatoria sp. SIO1A7]|nr:hypothetical protein [Oscillatoria sp. SIO1A7]
MQLHKELVLALARKRKSYSGSQIDVRFLGRSGVASHYEGYRSTGEIVLGMLSPLRYTYLRNALLK